ncbi:MAG: hypothetical protein ACLFQH_06355, partial [Halothiobacillaceae bacterium]
MLTGILVAEVRIISGHLEKPLWAAARLAQAARRIPKSNPGFSDLSFRSLDKAAGCIGQNPGWLWEIASGKTPAPSMPDAASPYPAYV